MSQRAVDRMEPWSHPYVSSLDSNDDHRADWLHPMQGVPRVGKASLASLSVDFLEHIPFSAYQADEHDRQTEIGRGACSVACQHTETTTVGVHFWAQRYLHREV